MAEYLMLFNKIKILAIDGEPDNLITIKALIREIFPDALIFTSFDGSLGLDLAFNEIPDVILLGMTMPGLDSFQLCRKLKSDNRTADIPVVFMTSLMNDHLDRIQALECGGDAYLAKPIDKSELSAQLRAMIRIRTANIREKEERLNNGKENEARKQIEQVLHTSQERRLALLKTAMDGFWLTDMQGNLLEVNETYCRMTGYSEEELLKMQIGELEAFENEVDIQDHRKKLMENGVDRFESKHRRKDGTIFDVEINSHYKDEDGGYFLTFIHDITRYKQAEQAARANEEHFRSVLDNSKDVIYRFNLQTRAYEFMSKASLTMLKFEPEEMMSMPNEEVLARVHPDDLAGLIADLKQVEQTGYHVSEYRFLSKDEQYHWWSNSMTLIRDHQGKPLYRDGVVRDITANKMAEETLVRTKENLRGILDATGESIYLFDSDLNIIIANETAAGRLGRALSEIIGQPFSSLIPSRLFESRQKRIREVFSSGKPHQFEDTREGIIFEHHLFPVFEKDRVAFVVSYSRDITDRKNLETAIYESERKLSDLYNSMTEGIALHELIYDNNGKAIDYRILEVNPAFETITGISRKQAIGRKATEVFGTPASPYLDIYSQAESDNTATSFETFFPPMKKHFLISVFSPGKGKFATVFQDITSRKIADELIHQSEEKFRNLVGDMQVGVLLQGPNAEILLTNPKALELLGLTEDQLLGKTSFDPDWNVIHEDGSPFPGQDHPVPQAIATRRPVREVIMGVFNPSTGLRNWLMVHAEPQLDPAGEILQVVCTFIDVTSRIKAERELRESEQRLKFHLENSPLAVLEWDANFVVIQWMGEASNMFGLTKEEVLGKRIDTLDLVYEEDIPIVNATMERLLSGKEFTVVSSNRNKRKTGEIIDCTWYNSVVLDPCGKMISVMSLVQDITQRKQAEAGLKHLNEELEDRVKMRTAELESSYDALSRAEEKYRTVADFTHDWEFWIDQNGQFLYCSPSCEIITGFPASQFMQNSNLIFDIIHPKDRNIFDLHKESAIMAHEGKPEIEYRIICANGSIRWLGHVCKPIYNASGDYLGIRGTNRDITVRKKMERLLKYNQRRYRLLSENITDGIFICRDSRLDYVNKSMYDILGYQGESLLGLRLSDLALPDYRESLNNLLSATPLTNQYTSLEIEFLRSDQSRVSVEMLFNYVANGRVIYGVAHDITEKKQQQQNILKAIIQTEENERAYFSKELHDGLGPLLSTIKLYLQWSERPKSNQSREVIVLKAQEILEEALLTVKEISNKLSPHLLTNYGLTSAIQNFIDKLSETSAISISFDSNVRRRLEPVIEAALYRAIIECINNTLQHAQANHIKIELKDNGNQLLINYKDNGIGFDPEETIAQQKGLGLFNLQNRVQTIGGRINLIGKPGHGIDYQIVVNV